MAKKSKTQRAKAQANRAAKKAAREHDAKQPKIEKVQKEEPKGVIAKRKAKKEAEKNREKTAAELRQERRDAKMAAKENRAPKKHGRIVQFFIDVKAEMKRVTWPEKKDVAQWTGVVIGALVFFGVYVAVLDSFIVTPLLVAISKIAL